MEANIRITMHNSEKDLVAGSGIFTISQDRHLDLFVLLWLQRTLQSKIASSCYKLKNFKLQMESCESHLKATFVSLQFNPIVYSKVNYVCFNLKILLQVLNPLS